MKRFLPPIVLAFFLALLFACTSQQPIAIEEPNPSVVFTRSIATNTSKPTNSSTPAHTATPISTLTPEKLPSASSDNSTVTKLKHSTLQLNPIETNPNQAKFDLDTGEVVGVDDPTADIEYHREQGHGMLTFSIMITNGAKTLLYSPEPVRTYEDCLKHYLEFIGPLNIADVSYEYEPICILTSEGKLSLLIWQQSWEQDDVDWVQFKHITSIDPILVE